MASLVLLSPEQIITFDEIVGTGFIGLAVTMGYKGLSGLIGKVKMEKEEVYTLIRKLVKELKQQ
jgi:hypothetical protein